jgi:hypothetical protein
MSRRTDFSFPARAVEEQSKTISWTYGKAQGVYQTTMPNRFFRSPGAARKS